MTFETWLFYVGTVLILMSTPGPSQLLMLSTSLSNGFHRSLATAAGDLSANAIQITLSGLGLAVIVTRSQYGFAMIKWAGVAYLIWIGVKQIRASFKRRITDTQQPHTSLRRLWLRGFITSAANPKAVVFFAALFPQFLNLEAPLPPQIFILGATYIFIDGCFLSMYGKTASYIADKLRSHHTAWIDRIGGSSLIAAAVFLGLKTNQHT